MVAETRLDCGQAEFSFRREHAAPWEPDLTSSESEHRGRDEMQRRGGVRTERCHRHRARCSDVVSFSPGLRPLRGEARLRSVPMERSEREKAARTAAGPGDWRGGGGSWLHPWRAGPFPRTPDSCSPASAKLLVGGSYREADACPELRELTGSIAQGRDGAHRDVGGIAPHGFRDCVRWLPRMRVPHSTGRWVSI